MDKPDLHECQDSIKSEDSVRRRECIVCLPEYYCVDYCGEAGSISSYISWQHFPRSTSSRSNCNDISESTEKSFEELISASSKEEEKDTTPISSIVHARSKSIAELRILHYFEIRHIYELLNFLLSHLVCNEPDNPVTFLEDILDKCLKFRDEYGEPPLLFTHDHIQSLYHAFDPFERGYITVGQYHEAIKALGLSSMPYNHEPPTNDEGFVSESDFILEATNNLVQNLRRMLRIPEQWEENMHRWKKVMEKRRSKQIKKNAEIESKTEFSGEDYVQYTKRYSVFDNKSYKPAILKEPKQLFLN